MQTQLKVYLDNTAGYSFSDTTDISSQISSVSIRRKRDLISDQYQAGTAILRINDTNGDWNPQNTSSPYYNKVKPMAKVTIYGVVQVGGGATNTITIYKGYIESSKYSYPKNQDIGYLDINVSDALRILTTSAITSVTGAYTNEPANQRFIDILNMISWPAGLIDITYNTDVGEFTTLGADPGTSRAVLDAINEVAFACQGLTYCLRNGSMGLFSRNWLYAKQSDAPYCLFTNGTITNTLQFPYFDLRLANVDNLIYNQAQITANGGTMQTYTDNTSVTAYRLRNYYHSNTVNKNDADAYSVAASYVMGRKNDVLRAEVLTVKMTQIEPLYQYAARDILGITLGSKIRIYNENINNTTIDLTQFVFSESHDITPTEWTISWGTYKELMTGFILDSTTEGILDTSTLGW